MKLRIALLFLMVVARAWADTSLYVDPDWVGVHTGTAVNPWAALDSTTWSQINTALGSGNVTIYFSALKADGSTQQSRYGHRARVLERESIQDNGERQFSYRMGA